MNIKIKHFHEIKAYRLIVGNERRPKMVIECSDIRGKDGSRLFLGACLSARITKQIDSRQLDRAVLGLS
jgi:hypothetical protein